MVIKLTNHENAPFRPPPKNFWSVNEDPFITMKLRSRKQIQK